jgi:hypothetical protein
MYDRKAIRQLAEELAGLDPTLVVEHLKQHRAAAQEAQRQWQATRDRHCRASAQREFALEGAAQYRLAADFGAARGWQLTDAEFTLRTMAEGKQHDGRRCWRTFDRCGSNPNAGDFHDNFDHPYYYRNNRKAAAIAAHLYNYPVNRSACERIATTFGFQLQMPDFPSWWNPGATTLVVYVGPAGIHPKRVIRRRK